MRRPPPNLALALAVIVGGGALASCSSSTDRRATPTSAAASTTTVARGSRADSGAGGQWAAYGHDLANTRRNPAEHTITDSTVGRLRRTWSIDGIVGVTGTPAVVDGVAYFDDWTGAVHAVDARTGAPRWTTKLGGMFVGAPAVDGDRVFAAVGHMLYALDRGRGTVEWKVDTDENPFAQINASPVVIDGLVVIGSASFENIVKEVHYTFRGSIAAYDARTGAQRWKLFTTANDAHSGAGVGVWSTPAVDRARGLLFVGTGQNVSPPTGPLADSIIAVDVRTGKLRWSRQFTYPDVFSAGHPQGKDADVGASPNLWTSYGHDLVGAGDKGGTFHALDRDTGTVVWERQLSPGSAFGGEIGSAAFVDGRLIASSNIGDPKSNFPTDRTRVFALDPANDHVIWATAPIPGKVFGPVSAVDHVAFVGTDRGRMLALDVARGTTLWSYSARLASRAVRRSSTGACCGATASSCSDRRGRAA